jgi:serine/threonine protein kinase
LWGWALGELAPRLPNPFMPELTALAQGDDFKSRLERLSAERNRLAHPARAIEPDEARGRLAELRPDFDALVESIAFLGGYHLVGAPEAAQPVRRGTRAMLAPLRGRRISSRDIPLVFEGNIAMHDVALINPTVSVALVLRPFFALTRSGSSDDVLTLNRFDDAGLVCYATSRPDTLVREAPLRDDDDRTLSPWSWLESGQRRSLRVAVVSSDDRLSLDSVQRLRRSQHGSDDLPLRDLRHLASGGMSEIYVGVDPPSDTLRVMKVARDPNERSVRRLFEEEYRTLLKLRHPGVVMVYTCQFVEGVGPCIIEELFDHPTLQEHLAQGSFEPIEVEVILRALLDAVSALHALGIVHRDLKPANVLCERASGAIKVIDLGIARRLDATSHPTTRMGHGTPEIMAPEQMRGGTVSPASDVYALGLVARALYCGLDSMGWRPDDITSEKIPEAVRPVLARATKDDPSERFVDARALLEALEGTWVTSLPPSEPNTVEGVGLALDAEMRERLAAETVKVFLQGQRRVALLRESVGYTTAADGFAKEMRSIFDDTRTSLEALMSRAQLSDPDDVSRIGGLRAGATVVVGAFAGAASAGAMLGQFAGLGSLLGVAGLIAVPMAGGVFSVVMHKKRLLRTCDAAAAALDDAKGAVLAAIRTG